MILQHTERQLILDGAPDSELVIEVNYCPEDGTVEKIERVWVYSYRHHKATDITAIMSEIYEDQLEGMIEKIDWREKYLGAIDHKKERA